MRVVWLTLVFVALWPVTTATGDWMAMPIPGSEAPPIFAPQLSMVPDGTGLVAWNAGLRGGLRDWNAVIAPSGPEAAQALQGLPIVTSVLAEMRLSASEMAVVENFPFERLHIGPPGAVAGPVV